MGVQPNCNVVAQQQFKDNVMLPAKGPSPETTMYKVCRTLQEAWSLDVLCPYRDKKCKKGIVLDRANRKTFVVQLALVAHKL